MSHPPVPEFDIIFAGGELLWRLISLPSEVFWVQAVLRLVLSQVV
jgi:hypothetical protein